MTRAEELTRNLSLEYLFYQRYLHQWQQDGNLSKSDWIRLKNTIRAILRTKRVCREELTEDEYPVEYYYENPEELPELLLQEEETLLVKKELEIPDNDGIQMHIMDYVHDGNISWR